MDNVAMNLRDLAVLGGKAVIDAGTNQYMAMLDDTYPFNVFKPEYDGMTIFTPHWHEECLELIFITEGRVELHVGGQSWIGAEGDLVLIGEGVIHSGYVVDRPPMFYTILLDRKRLASSDFMNVTSRDLLTGKLELPGIARAGDAGYEACTAVIHAIIREFDHKPAGYEVAMKSYLHVLLLELTRSYGMSPDEKSTHSKTVQRRMERLKESISHIEAHYAEKLSVKEIAHIAGLSPYHFCRVFKHAVGRTFTEYIHLYRIGKAEALLRDTDLPITRIAELTGFGTIQYLDELFKRYRGCTPAQYRKRSQ